MTDTMSVHNRISTFGGGSLFLPGNSPGSRQDSICRGTVAKGADFVLGSTQPRLFTLSTPSMPVLDTSRCHTRPISYETAANMVEKYHYAHRAPSIVVSIGMYVDDVLAGCATCGIPPNYRAISSVCGDDWTGLEFNRLFVHEWAGRNSESWLIGQLFRWLETDWPEYVILVSYADPTQGHVGYVYQATNWLYLGAGSPLSGSPAGDMLIDGQLMSSKNVSNQYGTRSISKLSAMGLDASNVETLRKHRYVYFLGQKAQRRALQRALRWKVLPYPKQGQPNRLGELIAGC